MASGPLAGGGGDGSRRWSENKVYTRKIHKKPPQPPPASSQTPAIDDLHSSHQQPPPSPEPPQPPSAPSAASDDDASSLNPANGDPKLVSINLASCSPDEVRELRRRFTAELEQVRGVLRKLESRELEMAAPPAPNPATEYAVSQFSGSNDAAFAPKRAPVVSEGFSTSPAAAPPRRPISVSVPDSTVETLDKRTPKANQYYRNSEFLLAKDKFPPADSHRKSKANGSRKHEHGVQAVDKKLYGPAFKSCTTLLARVMKHKFAWVFNTPVDVKGLELHDYYSIIKQPMDLGTVKTRLSKNWYKTPEEFAEDVRLTFSNAMTYNPEGQDVHYMAKELLQMFEERWPAIEAECTHLLYAPPPKKPPPFDMRTLERSDSTAYPVPMDSRSKVMNHIPHTSRPPALKKPKAKDLHKRDMTFEEKQKLSNNLQNLPPEKLDNIVQIIKKRNLSLSQHDDEIEVDIDSVDAETLWELDRFVTNYKKSLSKHKRKAELAMQRAQADNNMQGRLQEKVPVEVPRENMEVDDHMASSRPVGGENNENNASSSSCSSSSDSGSSSSDSDSESSSGYGSEAGHSPRT